MRPWLALVRVTVFSNSATCSVDKRGRILGFNRSGGGVGGLALVEAIMEERG